jgi:prepilin-type N-terminal cleavage/methylation domain-containing protein
VLVKLLSARGEEFGSNPEFRFYADGSASGGQVVLSKNGVARKITLHWLTGAHGDDSSRRWRMTGSQEGFSLIEVLVAFTILSITIIVGHEIASDGLDKVRQAERERDILADVRSLFAMQQVGIEIDRSARDTGSDVGLSFRRLSNAPVTWTPQRPTLLQVKSNDKVIAETVIIHEEELP